MDDYLRVPSGARGYFQCYRLERPGPRPQEEVHSLGQVVHGAVGLHRPVLLVAGSDEGWRGGGHMKSDQNQNQKQKNRLHCNRKLADIQRR